MNRNSKNFSHHPYKNSNNRSTFSGSSNDRNIYNNNNNNYVQKYIIHNESEAELYIYPLFKYEQNFPKFQQPIEVGSIVSEKRKSDLDSKRKKYAEKEESRHKVNHLNEANGLRYLVMPNESTEFKFDLKLGLSEFVQHIPHQNGIDNLLKWVLENKSLIANDNLNKPLKIDFLCWRGLLTKVLATPYDKKKDWMFSIVLYKGTYYLCEIETEKEKDMRINMDEKTKNLTYWGHKFEAYITADLPDDQPDGTNEVPDPENNYGSVVKSKLDKYDLVYAAEIDCCLNKEHKLLSDYCELKTCRGNSYEDLNLERNMKYLKWWLQSYLVDIQVIKIGMRDDDGIVSKIIECTTRQIYESNNNRKWKPNICFNFLKSLFDLLFNFCTEENIVYLAYKPSDSNSVKFSKSTNNQHNVLRDWYTSVI